jgi:hypothetical protein
MKCEICDRDFPNSEAVQLHMERDHPLGERQYEELEKPDLIEEPVEDPATVVRPGR